MRHLSCAGDSPADLAGVPVGQPVDGAVAAGARTDADASENQANFAQPAMGEQAHGQQPSAGGEAQNAITTAHIALHWSASSYAISCAMRAPNALLPLRVVAVLHRGQAVK